MKAYKIMVIDFILIWVMVNSKVRFTLEQFTEYLKHRGNIYNHFSSNRTFNLDSDASRRIFGPFKLKKILHDFSEISSKFRLLLEGYIYNPNQDRKIPGMNYTYRNVSEIPYPIEFIDGIKLFSYSELGSAKLINRYKIDFKNKIYKISNCMDLWVEYVYDLEVSFRKINQPSYCNIFFYDKNNRIMYLQNELLKDGLANVIVDNGEPNYQMYDKGVYRLLQLNYWTYLSFFLDSEMAYIGSKGYWKFLNKPEYQSFDVRNFYIKCLSSSNYPEECLAIMYYFLRVRLYNFIKNTKKDFIDFLLRKKAIDKSEPKRILELFNNLAFDSLIPLTK